MAPGPALALLALAAAAAARGACGAEYTLRITAGEAAPDGGTARPVLLVNGAFTGPAIEVAQGDVLSVTVANDVVPSFPTVSDGLSVHWHGLANNGTPWLDGAAHVNGCPLRAGATFDYSWRVGDPPGSYMYHAHSGVLAADGLWGPLIVREPAAGGPAAPSPNASAAPPRSRNATQEAVLMLADWYWQTSGEAAKGLNRPFDPALQTASTGSWQWVGNPQSVLINGAGCAADCAPPAAAGGPAACVPVPECAGRYELEVEAGRSYYVRVMNVGSLTYKTVCVAGHNLTLVAADARPVAPLALGECVDVAAGQRADVTFTADATPAAYWLSVAPQYRPGAPAAYGVVRYAGAAAAGALPAAPAPQPAAAPQPWGPSGAARVRAPPDTPRPPPATLSLTLEVAQPVLAPTGQLRWALSNVAGLDTPSCSDVLALTADPGWLAANAAIAVANGSAANSAPGGAPRGLDTQAGGGDPNVYVTLPFGGNGAGVLPAPAPGLKVVELAAGDVVDVLVQNNAANAFGGGGANRTSQETHPFHLHGHHFWEIGSGFGVFDAANVTQLARLNLIDPPLRDTASLPPGGWLRLRFVADNPGAWPLHCHILWHQWMGQKLVFLEARADVPPLPEGLPKCPETCLYNAAPWEVGPPPSAAAAPRAGVIVAVLAVAAAVAQACLLV